MDRMGYVGKHLDCLIEGGRASGYGHDDSAMWMASLDTRTGRYPADDRRPAHIPKRCYRNIDAPKGVSLYWDQPQIVAARRLSVLTGDRRFADAADAYLRDFLARCVATNGIFLWGNHYYYDVFRGAVMWFVGEEPPRESRRAEETGALHEARPVMPDWESFWRIDPAATERCIRALAERHTVAGAEPGCFNRHADGRTGCAFLESGGILVETLCWLAAKVGDPSLAACARQIAEYSFGHRDPETGLLENNPTETRWDKHGCTTEVGLWAGSLLRAAAYTGDAGFVEMADQAMRPYLKYGFDRSAERYYGHLRVADGSPVLGLKTTPFQPGAYASLWEPLFPAHDYPLAFAETCAALFARTAHAAYHQAVCRWIDQIEAELPANGGRGAYAEHYGRAIHFLLRADDLVPGGEARRLAEALADETIRTLWAGTMFRTHPGEDRYDAVDGVGHLLLALLELECGQAPLAGADQWLVTPGG